MVEIAPFAMVVLIVAIIAFSRVQRAKYAAQRLEADAPRDDRDTVRLEAELRQLKERIAVLERIATDGDHDRSLALHREIEALRMPREQGQ